MAIMTNTLGWRENGVTAQNDFVTHGASFPIELLDFLFPLQNEPWSIPLSFAVGGSLRLFNMGDPWPAPKKPAARPCLVFAVG